MITLTTAEAPQLRNHVKIFGEVPVPITRECADLLLPGAERYADFACSGSHRADPQPAIFNRHGI